MLEFFFLVSPKNGPNLQEIKIQLTKCSLVLTSQKATSREYIIYIQGIRNELTVDDEKPYLCINVLFTALI
jgi:hypothetical protein